MAPLLRLCFSYCAIFIKGHDIYEDDLVHQWMALDFIKKPSEGKQYINQLLGLSFLQHSKLPMNYQKKMTRYTMHDLVHDLARSVVGDELIVINDAANVKKSEKTYCRYALLINYDGRTKLSDILPEKVWALRFLDGIKLDPRDGSFSFAKCLRILDFSECGYIFLPSSIGQLKQLKYIVAPDLLDKDFPETICSLSKLQYLNLRGSSQISALPESICKLSSLLYLGLSSCSGILKVPDGFGGLKSLVHLDMSSCYGITTLPDSLGNLKKLQHLDLSICLGLKEIPESLCGLNQLRHLNLSDCRRITKLPESIGSLNNLVYLTLNYASAIGELPRSFQNLQSLVHLDLSFCHCGKGLPEVLHGLTSLGHLDMRDFGTSTVMSLEDLFDAMGKLTKLKYLDIGWWWYSGEPMSFDFIGALTNLEHLVLRGNDVIRSLPHSIGNLKKLHTLDLSGCQNLTFIPDSIGEITTLKHVSLDGCSDEVINQVNSKLHYSLALPLFNVVADVDSGRSNLALLKDTNVGDLRISSIHNVRSLEEACEVKLLEKHKLLDLTLAWNSEIADRFVSDKDLLGQLVPPIGLKSLGLEGYSSQSFPSWFMDDISHHLPNLVSITLDNLPKCNNLPPLGQLPNLELLTLRRCVCVAKIGKDFCGGRGAFPRLSNLELQYMEGLEEWCTIYSFEDGVEELMFRVLDELYIDNCPRLRLTPRPPVCRVFRIVKSDRSISSLEEPGHNIGHLTSSTPTIKLSICHSESQSLRVFHHFPALQELELSVCNYLTGLPDGMRELTSLQSLRLVCCGGIKALPEWLEDLSSLKSLTIVGCDGIKSLPACIQRLTALQTLEIKFNPELKRWCELKENKKKLVHKKIIYIDCEPEDEPEDQ